MKIIKGNSNIIAPSVATIGFFDGVHRGHRFLLEQVRQVAAEQGMCSSVVTFSTHPRQLLQPDFCPLLLSSLQEKISLLEQAGMDYCVLLPFTHQLAHFTARAFMQHLHREYNVRMLVIGYDHRFGHNRAETFEDYQHYGEELGIRIVRAQAYTQGEGCISSSAVRRFLQQGDVVRAASCLGYPYSLTGIVVDGYKVGRRMGFPTANLLVEDADKLVPMDGVYAVAVYVRGQKYAGMLNVGHRPTLDNGNNRSIEVHIIDFSGDIYRERICLEFLRFLRPEIKFPSVDALVAQIRQDAKTVRELVQVVDESER